MKKICSLLLCLSLIITCVPTHFADEKSAGEKLFDLGLVRGDENANLNEASYLKREDAVILLLRMLGEEDKAEEYTGDCSFTDVDDGAYYYNAISYAEHKKLTNGMGKHQFGVNKYLTEKETLAFLLRALGYDNIAWEDVIYQAEDIGLTEGLSVQEGQKAIRAKVFEYMLLALDANINGDEISLGSSLGLSSHVKEDKKVSKIKSSTKPKIVDIRASSLKSIAIHFNKEMSSYDINKSNINVKKASYKLYLDENKKRVQVIFNKPLKDGQTLNITIKGLSDVDGNTIEPSKHELIINDDVKPRLISAEFLDRKTLKLVFSEPIDISSEAYHSISEIDIDGSNPKLEILKSREQNECLVNLKEGLSLGEHKVVLEGMKDYANNFMEEEILFLNLKDDLDEPMAKKVEIINASKILVYFDEPVYKKGRFKIGSHYSRKETYFGELKNIIELTFDSGFKILKLEEERLMYKGQEDRTGNKVKEWESIEFDVDKDETNTGEVEMYVNSDNNLVLDFSQPMNKNYGKVTLLDEDGDKVLARKRAPFTFVKDSNDGMLVIDFDYKDFKKGNAKVFNVKLEGFKDATYMENELDEVEEEVKTNDYELPKLLYSTGNQAVKIEKSEYSRKEDTVTFRFTEAMNEDDLTDLSNYHVSSSDFGNFSHIDGCRVDGVYDEGKTIVFVLPNAREIRKSADFSVSGLRDLAGNKMKAVHNAKIINSSSFVLKNAVAKKKNEIDLRFSQDIETFDESAYQVLNLDGGTIAVKSYEISSEDAKKVTIYLEKDLGEDVAKYVISATEYIGEVTSIFDAELTKASSSLILNDIRPYVKEVVSENGKFIVTMSEEVLLKIGDSKSVDNKIYIYQRNGILLKNGVDYNVVKLEGSTQDYASKFEIVGTSAFKNGSVYRITITTAWGKSGKPSVMFDDTVELKGESQ